MAVVDRSGDIGEMSIDSLLQSEPLAAESAPLMSLEAVLYYGGTGKAFVHTLPTEDHTLCGLLSSTCHLRY